MTKKPKVNKFVHIITLESGEKVRFVTEEDYDNLQEALQSALQTIECKKERK